jgi:hypothetical protein
VTAAVGPRDAPHPGAILASSTDMPVRIFVLPALLPVAACSAGETTFTLALLDEVEQEGTASWEVAEEHEISCANDEAAHTSLGGNLVIVQGGARGLVVEIDAADCDGLPDAVSLARLLVRWSDDALGVLGVDVASGEGADVGFDALGAAGPTYATATDFDLDRLGGIAGAPFELGVALTSALRLDTAGVPELCACDGLQVTNLLTAGAITRVTTGVPEN